ncbi:WAT1-related protein [Rhynchospora pubera]|uniref:WAT1-related protein n=1 Tax=Rhynchospora pubera TaxID=906938 RepID=A0AAV8C5W7_9POAL|nr:WAT1-related protein [Rhynchospora pubera]
MEDKTAYIVVLIVQFIYGGHYILGKDALNGGMPTTIFVFYRLLLGTLFFVPVALVFGRKNAPKLSWKIAAKIFFLALFGATFVLNIFSLGVKYSSSTVTSAISNAIPVVTFALAVLLRMETVTLKKLKGIVKIFGVLLCLAGVIVLAFYEGPSLKSVNHHRPFLHGSNKKQGPHSKMERIVGIFILVFFTVVWSLWIILQRPILKEYPSKLLFSTMCSAFGAVQSFFVAWIVERDFNKWKLQFDDTLVAVLYSGIIVSGVSFYMQVWCVEKKGPVFFAIWQPLCLLVTLACSSFFLGEIVKLGSVLGGLLMVGGLYSVLWGKQREIIEEKQSTEKEIKCQELPEVNNGTNHDQAITVPDFIK